MEPGVTQLHADYRGVKHRELKIERCRVGFLVTFKVVRDVKEWDRVEARAVDDRCAYATLSEALTFAQEYFEQAEP